YVSGKAFLACSSWRICLRRRVSDSSPDMSLGLGAELAHPRWNKSNTPSAYTRTARPAGGALVRYPAGCVSLPIGGGGMLFLSPLSPPSLLLVVLRLFRATRSAMSTLASVVSLGSPGSKAWSTTVAVRSELARWRLVGGCEVLALSVLRWPSGPPPDSG